MSEIELENRQVSKSVAECIQRQWCSDMLRQTVPSKWLIQLRQTTGTQRWSSYLLSTAPPLVFKALYQATCVSWVNSGDQGCQRQEWRRAKNGEPLYSATSFRTVEVN